MTSRDLFQNTSPDGMKVPLNCDLMARKSARTKLQAISGWIRFARDDECRSNRIKSCGALIEAAMIQE